MRNKKRSRLVPVISLMACAIFFALALGGCGIAHGPYGHGYNHGPRSSGSYPGWGPGPMRYHDPSGMNMYPNYRRDSRYYP